MSKSSQESSPITQWQTKVKEALQLAPIDLHNAVGADGKWYPLNVDKSVEAITSATIELLLELVGPDEPAIYEVSFGSNGGPSYAGIARNHLRAELRQSLKELSSD